MAIERQYAGAKMPFQRLGDPFAFRTDEPRHAAHLNRVHADHDHRADEHGILDRGLNCWALGQSLNGGVHGLKFVQQSLRLAIIGILHVAGDDIANAARDCRKNGRRH